MGMLGLSLVDTDGLSVTCAGVYPLRVLQFGPPLQSLGSAAAAPQTFHPAFWSFTVFWEFRKRVLSSRKTIFENFFVDEKASFIYLFIYLLFCSSGH
jgi:hypothetical protein